MEPNSAKPGLDRAQAEGQGQPSPKLRVRMFGWSDRWVQSLIGLMSAVHEGFWLGLMDGNDLNSVTALQFDQSRHYASIEHNLSGFQPWEKSALDACFRPASRILVAGAGAGREILALRKAGYEADGFECNLALVRAGEAIFQQVGEPRPVLASPPDAVPPGAQIYDGLIAGWSAYTHIPTRIRRIKFLRSLRQRAAPGSPLLLSFFTRPEDCRFEKIVLRTAALSRLLPGGRDDRAELGDRLNWKRYSHSFTKEELESELKEAGFRLARFQDEGASSHAVAFLA